MDDDDDDDLDEEDIAAEAYLAMQQAPGRGALAREYRDACEALGNAAMEQKAQRLAREQRAAREREASRERERLAAAARNRETDAERARDQRRQAEAERQLAAETADRELQRRRAAEARRRRDADAVAADEHRRAIERAELRARNAAADKVEAEATALRRHPGVPQTAGPAPGTRPHVELRPAPRTDERGEVSRAPRVRPASDPDPMARPRAGMDPRSFDAPPSWQGVPAARTGTREGLARLAALPAASCAPSAATRPVSAAGRPVAEPQPLTGADLAAHRRVVGMTQSGFADWLGVTQGTVSKAEGNPRALLGPAVRLALWRRQRERGGG